MGSSNYNVNLRFTADTNDAKRQIQSLQKALQEVAKMPGGANELFDDQKLNRASQAALELQQHLSKAVNVNTGKLDLSRFSTSLKASNQDLSSYCNTLLSVGEIGQDAFLELATAISTADVPLTNVNKKILDLGTSIKNAAKWQISSSIIHGFMGAVQGAYGYAEDLNESLNNIRIVTGQTTAQMDKFAASANKAAKALSATTLDYTNASLIYYQQGLTDQQVKERTDVTIKMANVAQQSATVVSDQMTAIWNNFYDGSKSLEYYADVLVKLGAATASSTDEIAGGLEKFAAIGQTIGLSYEYAASALATITSNTRQSEEVVGTALKTIFARIQDLELGETLEDGTSLGSYAQALKAVGVDVLDTAGQMRKMDDILDDLAAKWDGLSSATKTATAQAVAGTRQYVQLVALMDNWNANDADSMTANLGYTRSATGELDAQAEIYAESWEAARDRVQAALESIYSEMVNDDFFITMLNAAEKALTTLKGFIDGLGGIKGILLTISSIWMSTYAHKMPEILQNLKSTFMRFTGQAKEETIKVQQSMSQIIKGEADDTAMYDLGYSVQLRVIDQVNKMKQQLILKSKDMTEQEKLEAQIRIDNVAAIGQETAALAKQAQAARDTFKATLSRASTSTKTTVASWGDNIKQARKNQQDAEVQFDGATDDADTQMQYDRYFQLEEAVDNYISKIEDARIALANFSSQDFDLIDDEQIADVSEALKSLTNPDISDDAYKDSIGKINSYINSLTEELRIAYTEYSKFSAATTGLESQGKQWANSKDTPEELGKKMLAYAQATTEASDQDEAFAAAQKVLQERLKESGTSIDKVKEAWKEYALAIQEIGDEKTVNISKKLDTLKSILPKLGMDPEEIKAIEDSAQSQGEALAQLMAKYENFIGAAGRTQERQVKLSESFTRLTSGIMSFAQSINLMKSAWDTLSDPDVTGWEKFGAVISLLSGVITLNSTLTSLNKVALDLNTKAKEKNVLASIKNALANGTLGESFKKLTSSIKNNYGAVAQLAVVIAAVVAIGELMDWLIQKLNKTYNANSIAAEQAAQSASDLATSYTQANEEFETLISTISDYEDAKNGLDTLRFGTAEFTSELMRANEQASSLLEKYGNIIGNRYLIDDKGLIKIDSQALEDVKNSQANELQVKQRASILANQQSRQATLSNKETELNRNTIQSREGLTGEDWNRAGKTAANGAKIGAGVGAAAGVAAAALGLVAAGPVGWGILAAGLLGAGAGAVVGGLAGGGGGLISNGSKNNSETTQEKQAIKILKRAYSRQGESAFTDIKATLEAGGLQEPAEDLVQALYDNKDSVEALCEEYKNNVIATKAENASQAQQFLKDTGAVEGYTYSDQMAAMISDDYAQMSSEAVQTYIDQLKGKDQSLWTQYVQNSDLKNLEQLSFEKFDDNGNVHYKYYDAEQKKFVEQVESINTMAAVLASLDMNKNQKLIEEAKAKAEALESMSQDTVDILEAFKLGDSGGLTFSQLMGFDLDSIDDGLFEILEISEDELKAWLAGIEDQYKKWKDNEWFESLSDEDKSLVIDLELDPVLSEEELEAEIERARRFLQDHPLQATIEIYDKLESAVSNGQWSEVANLLTSTTEQGGLGLSPQEANEILALGNKQAILDEIRKRREGQTQSEFGNRVTVEQASQDVEVAKNEIAQQQNTLTQRRNELNDVEAQIDEQYNVNADRDALMAYLNNYTPATQWSESAGPFSVYVPGVGTYTDRDAFTTDASEYFDRFLRTVFDDEIQAENWENYLTWSNRWETLAETKDYENELRESYIEELTSNEYFDDLDNLYAQRKGLQQTISGIEQWLSNSGNTRAEEAESHLTDALLDNLIYEDERTKRIEGYGLEADTVQAYRDLMAAGQGFENGTAQGWLETLKSKDIDEYNEALDDLSIMQARLSKGTKKLADNWTDWNKIMSKTAPTIDEVAEILPELQESMADILNWDTSDIEKLGADFYNKNWKYIQDVYNGVDGAIEKLSGLATQEYIVQVGILDNATPEAMAAYELLKQQLTDMPDLKLGMTIDQTPLNEAFEAMLNSGYFTVDQLNAILSNLNFSPEVYEKEFDTSVVEDPVLQNKVFSFEKDGVVYWVRTQDYQEAVNSKGKMKVIGINSPPRYMGGGGAKVQAPKTKSTSSGGSSKVEKMDYTKKSDVVERYKEVNDQLDNVADSMSKVQNVADKLWGKDHIKNLQSQNKLLSQQIALLEEEYEEALAYQKEDAKAVREAAEALGLSAVVSLDEGRITNIESIQEQIYNQLHAAEEHYNGLTSKDEQDRYKETVLEPLEKRIEAFEDAVGLFEESSDTAMDAELKKQEARLEQMANNFTIWTESLDIPIELNEKDVQYIEWLISRLEGDVYEMAEKGALIIGSLSEGQIGGQMEKYLNNLELADASLKDLESSYAAGEITQANYIEGLDKISETYLDNIQNLDELDKAMQELYGETISAATEELAKYTEQMEHSTSVLDHYKSVIELMGKSNDYEMIGKVLEGQAKTTKNQMEVSKQWYETMRTNADTAAAEYAAAQARGASEAELEILKQNWDEAETAANEAQEQMLSDTEAWVEKMKEVLENKLAGFGQTLENALTGGTSFDTMTGALERASSLQEEYLTTTNQIYETNKLMRQAQQEIDKTTNSVAKKRLAAYINETQQLQNQSKLSSYELEIQQAKYNLLLAEMALQEAQDAKSVVRLQRDSEGNLGYVYTADQDKIADAQQKLEDAQNSLYNIGLEGANGYVEKYSQLMSEMYDTITEIQSQYLEGAFESEEEYQNAIMEAKQYYYDKLKDYSSLYQIALTTDSRVVADAWSTDFADMTYNTAQWMDAIEIYVDQAAQAFKDWHNEVTGSDGLAGIGADVDAVAASVESVVDKSDELAEITINTVIPALDDEMDSVQNLTGSYATLRDTIIEIIDKYGLMIDTINGKKRSYWDGGTDEGGSESNANDSESTDTTPSDGTGGNSGNAAAATGLKVGDRVTVKGSVRQFSQKSGNQYMQEWVPGSEFEVFRIDGSQVLIGDRKRSGTYTGWVNRSDLEGFASGGYTGEWGSYGKLAMLHQKELVLNADDTKNFLASMELLDHILEVIDLQSASAQLGGLLTSPGVRDNNSTIEQSVHIEASFPNVQERSEIEEAFNNLINQASQYANRK